MLRLGAPPVLVAAGEARLVSDEQLDRLPEDRIGELARCRERLEIVAELRLEQVVDRREHLRPRAVVPAEREQVRRL